ncbi:juvenile hormone esterase-like [Hyposmocoma kahamanoa]|uniref:juvenile hormone esterase-like n=1 Tax=Hyposmocoma kahamanoa TaxID=1477025 RepID=UPI000E6DA015|nr:juvenile hormone esterase-like [Hyposmocoma kahamanoa]
MVKVEVEQGLLEGEQLDLVTGDGQYYSFKGVPYAEPPFGPLRFKAPQPPKPWSGIRKATEHGPVCPQKDIFTQQYVPGSEDCLYLNVYTRNLKPKMPLAVMVFIHGGGYKSGSGNEDNYGPDFLVNHDVVLVTINYRLEVLGFLCLDTEDVPGNAGMKDQVAALKWVQKNIAQFGGDPKNVTIFGESAGGASAALHVLSPMSKELFKRAIPMSGVPLCEWSTPFEPKRRAFVLGKQLGFETNDACKLLHFLQSVPVEKLVDVSPCVISAEEALNNILKMYHFTPVVEKDFGAGHFLTIDPEVALRSGKVNEVDVMIGYTDKEAIVGIPAFETLLQSYSKYPEILVPRQIFYNSSPIKVLELADKIKTHYFGDKQITVDSMKEAVVFFCESCFPYYVTKYIRLLPKIGNTKRYMYCFSNVSERNIYGQLGAKYGITGASHLDDLMYLFDAKKAKLSIDKSSKSYKMIQETCALFTNFAKFGNPTPNASVGVTWPEYDNVQEQYLDIGETLTPGKKLFKEAIEFWQSVYEYAEKK